MHDSETPRSDEDAPFPGSFADGSRFRQARKRLETHIFAHREELAPRPLPVSPIPRCPGPGASAQDWDEWIRGARASLIQQPRPEPTKLRRGRRALVVGHCPYDFLSPPSVS